MSSSDHKNNSIRNVLFDAAVQLSVPTVVSTASAATKVRTYSTIDEATLPSPSQSTSSKSRYSLSSALTYPARHSDVLPSKVLRDVATQSSPEPASDDKTQHRPHHLNLILDRNNNPTAVTTTTTTTTTTTKTTSSISDTSKEYLSVSQHHSHLPSPSLSPARHSKSLKTALLGIWQGLNSDELRSAASSPIDPKSVDDRVRLVMNGIDVLLDRRTSVDVCFRVRPVGKRSRTLSHLCSRSHEQNTNATNGFNLSDMLVNDRFSRRVSNTGRRSFIGNTLSQVHSKKAFTTATYSSSSLYMNVAAVNRCSAISSNSLCHVTMEQ
jgi:hypothetical protein